MKNVRENPVKLSVGTADEFFERSAERARKLGRGEKVPAEKRITFEDPLDLMRVLSAQRVRVLRTVRTRAIKPTVTSLAAMLKRDRKAVSRDVKLLESLGLVKMVTERNPGHGTMKVVEPLAEKFYLTATL